jgi:hypothetical protein
MLGQHSPIRRLLKTAVPFPYRRGAGALSSIDSHRARSQEVTIVNLQFPNFKPGCTSYGNWSKGMLTAALDRRLRAMRVNIANKSAAGKRSACELKMLNAGTKIRIIGKSLIARTISRL